VQRAMGALNHRIKDIALETVPPLPPLKLSREDTSSSPTNASPSPPPPDELAHPACSFAPDLLRDPPSAHREMATRRSAEAGRSSGVAAPAVKPLLKTRVKGDRELQTVHEMVGRKNSE
jgi:hypothetical protein